MPPSGSDVPGRTLDAAAVRRVWPDVMEGVKRRKRTPHAMLADAQVVAVENKTLVLSFPQEVLARRFADEVNTAVLSDSLREVLGVDWDIRCGSGLSAADTGGSAEAPAPPVGSGATSWEPAADLSEPEPLSDPGRVQTPGVDSFAVGDSAADDEDPADARPRLSPEDAAVALLRHGLGATDLPD